MTKTPYELRFELLQLAQGTLQSEYFARADHAKYLVSISDKSTHDIEIEFPDYPTTKDIFDLANEYKKFIDQK